MLERFLKIPINPVFLSEYKLKSAIRVCLKQVSFKGKCCLDVGCGERQYEYLFRGGKYFGIDVVISGREKKQKLPDVFYDGSLLPFQDNKFDLVLSTQVFEHVKNPFALMRELHRVCKPGGLIILTVPFVFPEHEKPFDFFRFSEHGAKQLYYDNDMVIEYLAKDSNEIDVITTIISLYVVSNLAPKIPGFRRLIALFICFPVQLLGLLLSVILPNSGDLYLNIVLMGKKI